MKSTKKLQAIYDKAKDHDNIKPYYSFDSFVYDSKNFIKDIKKQSIICSMKVSKSGMTRHFNVNRYNAVLNICYNQKFSHQPVKVSGCGMDMLWNLLFTTCEYSLMTTSEVKKHNINSKCSRYTIL